LRPVFGRQNHHSQNLNKKTRTLNDNRGIFP
jgi:hypothetical protein